MRSVHLAGKTHLRSRRRGPPPIASFDLTSGAHNGHPLQLGALAADAVMLDHMPDDAACDALTWCAALFAQSPTAKGLWDFADARDWSIAFGEMHAAAFIADELRSIVTLNACGRSPSSFARSAYLRHDLFCSVLQALREVWQTAVVQDACDPRYTPEDAVVLERVRAADADVVLLLTAWELRGAGHPGVWRHIIGSDHGDLVEAFADIMDRDPAALFDGHALGQLFRQWYADPARVDVVDHRTLEALDRKARDADDEAGQACAAPAIIEAMSELPDGTRYLDGMGWAIRNDSAFTNVGNIINRTHLMHLAYDRQVVFINNVPFRDAHLARLIFPD